MSLASQNVLSFHDVRALRNSARLAPPCAEPFIQKSCHDTARPAIHRHSAALIAERRLVWLAMAAASYRRQATIRVEDGFCFFAFRQSQAFDALASRAPTASRLSLGSTRRRRFCL